MPVFKTAKVLAVCFENGKPEDYNRESYESGEKGKVEIDWFSVIRQLSKAALPEYFQDRGSLATVGEICA